MKPHLHPLRTLITVFFAGVVTFGPARVGLAMSLPAVSPRGVLPNTSRPDGDTLFRQSFGAMARSLHAVHSEVSVRQDAQRLHSDSVVSGDCIMVVGSHRGQVWERGTTLYSTVVPIDIHFIEIGSMTRGSRTWRRATSTGNRWRTGAQPRREEDTAFLFLTACPLQLKFVLRAKDRTRFTNLGPARADGIETWHLHLVNSSNSTAHGAYGSSELYLDQRTLRWIQSSSVSGSANYRVLERVDYSRFNESVTITPPRVGSSTP